MNEIADVIAALQAVLSGQYATTAGRSSVTSHAAEHRARPLPPAVKPGGQTFNECKGEL
jgi:hypothetical protein